MLVIRNNKYFCYVENTNMFVIKSHIEITEIKITNFLN